MLYLDLFNRARAVGEAMEVWVSEFGAWPKGVV